jgi:hypothetical protein
LTRNLLTRRYYKGCFPSNKIPYCNDFPCSMVVNLVVWTLVLEMVPQLAILGYFPWARYSLDCHLGTKSTHVLLFWLIWRAAKRCYQ